MQTFPERAFSAVEKREALDLVLQSQTFARADQLRRFLRYICEMEEAGRADEITEYSIATEALGRPRSYSPAADSGVRGRAHDLRSKLDQFYETENPRAKLRIGLRKGSYAPFFYEVEPGPEMSAIVLPAPHRPTLEPRARTNLVRNFAAIAALIAIAVLATRAFYVRRTTQLDPIVKQFWGPLVRPGADVLLCLGTPPSLLIKPYAKPPNPDIFRPLVADKSAWYSRMKLPDVPGQPYIYFSGDSPLFGDAEAAAFAVRVLSAAGASFDFIPENTAQPAALRNQNVLLIGSPNYSEYAGRILRRTPFTIVEDSNIGEEVIREQTGKLKPKVFVPRRDESGSLVLVYGLITVFQNQALSEVNSRTIMVSGVTGAGSGAAMHFFTSASGLRTLLDRLHKEGLKEPPPAYQVVVKGTRDKALPLAWELADFKQMAHFPTLE
jgi:hypothetical protein